MAIETTTCDLCGATETIPVYSASARIEEADPGLFYTPERSQMGHFAIVRCKTCGLIRSRQRDDASTRSHAYQESTFEYETANRIQTFNRRARQLIGENGSDKYLLDIGCQRGYFIAEMMRLGWQAAGIDPSEKTATLAQELAPWAQIYVSEVDTAIFPGRAFDLITFWDGFEHTQAPRKVIERLSSWLEPGGILLLNLPNINSLEARLMGAGWPLLLREHIWYFSPKTIQRLLEESGYELVSIRPGRVCYSLAYLSKQLRVHGGWGKLLGALIHLPKPFSLIPFWISPGEMVVTARLKEIKSPDNP